MTAGLAILGATGSIGTSTLNVVSRLPDRFHVVALTAFNAREELERRAQQAEAKFWAVVNGDGPECLIEAATRTDVDIVVNAVVGAAGLHATLAALRAGKRVALANKETLVMAGDLVLQAARAGGGEIVPVDSEHSAVLQCITGQREGVRRIVLTASGGPFREWQVERVREATVGEALNHPTWQMGRKITIDSATLANKALEVIEAHYLFGLPYEAIDVVVHPQSIVHGFVEFVDGSVLSQVGFPSMELPILYALTYPDRVADTGVAGFDPVAAGPLTFEPIRHEVFPTFQLGVQAGRSGGTAPAVFNAANEMAVAAFLDGKIVFGRIAELIDDALGSRPATSAADLEDVIEADRWGRHHVESACS